MKISYKWLQDYIDLTESYQEVEDNLTFAGIEVEDIEFLGKDLNQFIIAEIIERKPHPNADKLSICKVDIGSDVRQVVCGAPNCDAHQKVVFAPVGTKIGDVKIKKAKLRGVDSFGMICSEKELGLSSDHSGIMIVKPEASVGQSLSTYLDRKDVCFDLEITPNRPDLLGIIGITRDYAAVTGKSFSLQTSTYKTSEESITNWLKLANKNPQKCTRYTARMVRNVEIKESPDWLKKRLRAVGLRPINNIVDISNFVMMEFGHPLHAFDYDKIKDQTIVIRSAEENEKFIALDDQEYQLSHEDLVIADSETPIALAGVIGGNNSQITENTKHVVIEAANFLYSSIRKTSSKHKIFSDSSYRFERDLADETAELISNRAVQLILELAKGEALSGMLDSFPEPVSLPPVKLRMKRLQQITTISFSSEEVINYLKPLGLSILASNKDELTFSIPYFRKDLTREIDLIEEVLRLHGYNKVEEQTKLSKIMNRNRFYQRRNIQDIFVNHGCNEVVNWSFGDPEALDKLNLEKSDIRKNPIKIKNPLGSRYSILRTMLLPDLLSNLAFNLNHGAENIRLFENNKVFYTDKTTSLANETEEFAAVFTGNAESIHWSYPQRKFDFFDIKAIFEEVMDSFGISNHFYQDSKEPYFQKGVAADIKYKGKIIGSLGKLDPKIAAKLDIKIPVFYGLIKFGEITDRKIIKRYQFKEISKYPTVQRDLSFVVSNRISIREIVQSCFQVNPSIIKKVNLFDEYQGEKIDSGYRSLSFSLSLNSHTKTLTDDYVNKLIQKLIKKLKEKFQIEMR